MTASVDACAGAACCVFQNGPRGEGIIGPLLTEDQRWALVEYLKSIPEEPGRITPFGGFPEGRLPQP